MTEPDRIHGYPVHIDENIRDLAENAKVIHFGDWDWYYERVVKEMPPPPTSEEGGDGDGG